jgi:hypothetical protein
VIGHVEFFELLLDESAHLFQIEQLNLALFENQAVFKVNFFFLVLLVFLGLKPEEHLSAVDGLDSQPSHIEALAEGTVIVPLALFYGPLLSGVELLGVSAWAGVGVALDGHKGDLDVPDNFNLWIEALKVTG